MAYREPATSVGSQAGRVYQEIKWRIVYGQYLPGTHLSESTLARLHKASRTPVREALARLSEDAYVQSVPARGFVIAPVTVAMIRNTFQLRRLLEGTAAENAAEAAGAEQIRRMRDVAEYHYEIGSVESYRASLRRNLEFHLAIASASRNDLLVDMVQYCLMQLDRVLSLGVDFKPFEERSTEEHFRIVEAIERRDGAVARREMERHLDRSGRLIMDNVMSGTIRGVML